MDEKYSQDPTRTVGRQGEQLHIRFNPRVRKALGDEAEFKERVMMSIEAEFSDAVMGSLDESIRAYVTDMVQNVTVVRETPEGKLRIGKGRLYIDNNTIKFDGEIDAPELRPVIKPGDVSLGEGKKDPKDIDCTDPMCKYQEPHKHGFGCDNTCWCKED